MQAVKRAFVIISDTNNQSLGVEAASFATKANCAKLLLELGEFKQASKLFELLLREDDRFVEVVSLSNFVCVLATCAYPFFIPDVVFDGCLLSESRKKVICSTILHENVANACQGT